MFKIKKRKYNFIVFITLYLASPGAFTTTQATESRNNSPVILILGDSLSAAHGISQKSAWSTLLQKRLTQQHYPHKVINASISGETSLDGLSRTDHVLSTHAPAIVILELGANDGLRGLPIKQMKINLSKIINKTKRTGAKILLIGMKIPSNYGAKYTQSFETSYVSLAQQYQLSLVPFMLEGISENRKLMQEDNLHPRAKAQPLILNNIWPYLENIVKK